MLQGRWRPPCAPVRRTRPRARTAPGADARSRGAWRLVATMLRMRRSRGECESERCSSSMPDSPSISAWCTLMKTANRSRSRPSTTKILQPGRSRSSIGSCSSAMSSCNCDADPGAGKARRCTCQSMSSDSATCHSGRPALRNSGTRLNGATGTARRNESTTRPTKSVRLDFGRSKTSSAPTCRGFSLVSVRKNIRSSIGIGVPMTPPPIMSTVATSLAFRPENRDPLEFLARPTLLAVPAGKQPDGPTRATSPGYHSRRSARAGRPTRLRRTGTGPDAGDAEPIGVSQ